MLSAPPTPTVTRPSTTAASVARFAGLVRKIETSPALSSRKRKYSARKKLTRVIREQRRFAKTTKLRAVALTLTYRDSAAFSPKHISSFLDRLRRTLKRAGHSLPYAWVPQAEAPAEKAIEPLSVKDFRVPGAAPFGPMSTVSVKGTIGYYSGAGHCVAATE